ncbi:MAG: sugar porter family MFS transporter [Chitinophagales bacterium]|nr:sugar porter family MFS transporter [Chitinophagales bacterium]
MNYKNLIFWSVTVALGGLLFGFDTAVISGGEQAIQQQWRLSDLMVGQMVGVGLYGTIAGAALGGLPAQSFGRRPTLLWVGILFLVCSVGSALAPNVSWLMFFRFLGGLAVGVSSVVAPMYIAEIAPTRLRGTLTALFQFNIVLGILLAYLSNWIIGMNVSDDNAWRWMLGVMAIPSVLYMVGMFFVPESPRWLISAAGKEAEARKILGRLDPGIVEESIAAFKVKEKSSNTGLSDILSGRFNKPILLVFLFAFFNQVSGINAVIYYAPRILKNLNLGDDAALLSTTGIGVVNLVFTMLGLALIDRFGRRFLMYIGSIGYILSLGGVAWAFFNNVQGWLVPVLLFVFIASHAIGQGAVIWVFISEIFPTKVRAFGNSLGSSTHWVFAALIAGLFPYFNAAYGGGIIFAFFAGMMFLQLLFVWLLMPETKGVSLEEMEDKLKQ